MTYTADGSRVETTSTSQSTLDSAAPVSSRPPSGGRSTQLNRSTRYAVIALAVSLATLLVLALTPRKPTMHDQPGSGLAIENAGATAPAAPAALDAHKASPAALEPNIAATSGAIAPSRVVAAPVEARAMTMPARVAAPQPDSVAPQESAASAAKLVRPVATRQDVGAIAVPEIAPMVSTRARDDVQRDEPAPAPRPALDPRPALEPRPSRVEAPAAPDQPSPWSAVAPE
jgi:hypothetical protein